MSRRDDSSVGRRRPLKVGVELPIAVDKGRHGTPRWGDVSRMARQAEEIGFDSVWIEDHLVFRHAARPAQGVWEGWAVIAAVAAVTSRVEIGPLVSCMSFRNPAYLAKLADTVEEISGGRLILGIGAGWHEPEYRAFGFPFDHRVSRFEEGLRIVQGLLRHGRVDFVGRYHEARDCELEPRGPRPGGPPILIGSIGERMLGLAARYADEWNAVFLKAEAFVDLNTRLDELVREAGRAPEEVRRTLMTRVIFGRTEAEVDRKLEGEFRDHLPAAVLAGTTGEIVERLGYLSEAGVQRVMLQWLEVDDIDALEAMAHFVLPQLRR